MGSAEIVSSVRRSSLTSARVARAPLRLFYVGTVAGGFSLLEAAKADDVREACQASGYGGYNPAGIRVLQSRRPASRPIASLASGCPASNETSHARDARSIAQRGRGLDRFSYAR